MKWIRGLALEIHLLVRCGHDKNASSLKHPVRFLHESLHIRDVLYSFEGNYGLHGSGWDGNAICASEPEVEAIFSPCVLDCVGADVNADDVGSNFRDRAGTVTFSGRHTQDRKAFGLLSTAPVSNNHFPKNLY